MSSAWRYGLAVAAVPLVAFLFVRSRATDPEDLNRGVEAARRLRDLDARIDVLVREDGAGRSRSYDPLAQTFREMHRLEAQIAASPSARDPAVAGRLLLARGHVRAKERLVEGLQSESAVLRNSVTHLSSGATLEPDVEHVRIVARLAPRVESATRDLSAMDRAPCDSLYRAVRSDRESAVGRTRAYRALLAAVLAGLLVTLLGHLLGRKSRQDAAGRAALRPPAWRRG